MLHHSLVLIDHKKYIIIPIMFTDVTVAGEDLVQRVSCCSRDGKINSPWMEKGLFYVNDEYLYIRNALFLFYAEKYL